MRNRVSKKLNFIIIIIKWLHILAFLSFIFFIRISPVFAETTAISAATEQIERKLKSTESNWFSVEMEESEIAEFKIGKKDLRILFIVSDQNGNQTFYGTYEEFGEARPWFIAASKGKYLIEIRSFEKNSDSKSYTLKITEKHSNSSRSHNIFQAEKLFQEGEKLRLLWTKEALDSALSRYNEAAEIWKTEKDRTSLMRSYDRIGEIYFIFGKYEQALQMFGDARKISRQIGNRSAALAYLCKITKTYLSTGNTKEIKLSQIKKELSQIDSGEGKDLLEAVFISLNGEYLSLQGDLGQARPAFENALELWRKLGDRRGEGKVLLELGFLNLDGGNILAAEENFDQALRIWKDLEDKQEEARTLTVQGHLYSFFDEWTKALDLHLQSKEISIQIGDRQGMAVAFNGMGNVYEFLGLPIDAANSYSQALEINEELNNPFFSAATCFALARAYQSQKEFSKAQENYQKGLRLSRDNDLKRIETYILANLAEIAEADNTAQALASYLQILPYFNEIKDIRGKALILNRIGNIYYGQKNFKEAEKAYGEALEINKKTEYNRGLSDSYYYLAEIELERNALKNAQALIEKSLSLSDAPNINLMSSTLKIAHRATVQEKIQFQIEVLMQMYKSDSSPEKMIEAFEKVERSRSRTLLEIIRESSIKPERDLEDSFFKQEKQLQNNIAKKIEEQIVGEFFPPSDKSQKEIERSLDETKRELDNLRAEYEQIERKKKDTSEFTKMTTDTNVRLSDIQAFLEKEPDTIYLTYHLGKTKSYLWAVTKSEIKAFELADQETLKTAVRNFYQLLTARDKSDKKLSREAYRERIKYSLENFCPQGKNLTRLLLDPVASELIDKRVLVSFDGALQYLPLETLPAPDALLGRESLCQGSDKGLDYDPLILTNEIVYTPSFSVLKTVRENRNSVENISRDEPELIIWANPVYELDDRRLTDKLGFVPAEKQNKHSSAAADIPVSTLPNTGIEANIISELWASDKVKTFTGFDVNRKNVLAEDGLSRYIFIHFAAHGFFNNERPQHSGLILSKFDDKGQSIDSVLSLQDIFRLRLKADLVVLSACQTGLGENFSGEGLTGFKHAFFSAGAKSVITGLWQVDDETGGKLMKEFYQDLVDKGIPSGKALQLAKIEVFKTKGWEEPYFWAALTLYGDYSVKILPETQASVFNWYICAAIIGGFILFAGAGWYGKRIFRAVKRYGK